MQTAGGYAFAQENPTTRTVPADSSNDWIDTEEARDRRHYLLPSLTRSEKELEKERAKLSLRSFDDLIARANQAVQDHNPSIAFELLSRLHHLGIRNLSASPIVAGQTLHAKDIRTQAKSTKPHPITQWAQGGYATVTTPHFEIASQASPKIANQIAIVCEQTRALWQQMYVPFWCSDEKFADAVKKNEKLELPIQSPMQIVVFRNRESYVKQLQSLESNIAVSTGYYNPKSKTVFCYWDEQTTEAVLRHEVTHQLFSEASYFESIPPEEMSSDFWIVEGVALYMESMVVSPLSGCDVATVGGWDSPRLQPARYRRLHDESWIEWPQFRRATSESFRSGKEIKLWYAQAAGLAHMWLDGEPKRRQQFIEYMQLVYQNQPTAMSKLPIGSDNELRTQYDQFLLSPSLQLPSYKTKSLSTQKRDIVLSQVDAKSEQLLEWPHEARSIDWLDLSFTSIDDQLFLKQGETPWNIRRLNLEHTKVTDASLSIIASIRKLEELDLSGTKVTDSGIEALGNHAGIKYLWLTGTSISDNALPVLLSLPRLESLEITGTQITESGKKTLLTKNPRLKKNRP